MESPKRFKNELVNTIIGSESEFRGVINTQRSIRIEGSLEGEINCQGEVFIGEKSRIKANIFGKKVYIAGEVIGNIETVSGLEIAKTGRVYGDISGDHLIIEEGGIYKGKVNMDIISSKSDYKKASQLVPQT